MMKRGDQEERAKHRRQQLHLHPARLSTVSIPKVSGPLLNSALPMLQVTAAGLLSPEMPINLTWCCHHPSQSLRPPHPECHVPYMGRGASPGHVQLPAFAAGAAVQTGCGTWGSQPPQSPILFAPLGDSNTLQVL